MEIDWAATGNWMQAWAGFAQAGAVIYVATKGVDAFRLWRRQKIGERKLDTAENILDVAYRARLAFSHIRNPMMQGGALEVARKSLVADDPEWMARVPERLRQQAIYGRAVFDRIQLEAASLAQLIALMPKARAYFGAEVEKQLKILWRQRAAVWAAAEAYTRDTGSDPAFSELIRRNLWEGYVTGTGSVNEIDVAIADACGRLESVLGPILSETVDLVIKP